MVVTAVSGVSGPLLIRLPISNSRTLVCCPARRGATTRTHGAGVLRFCLLLLCRLPRLPDLWRRVVEHAVGRARHSAPEAPASAPPRRRRPRGFTSSGRSGIDLSWSARSADSAHSDHRAWAVGHAPGVLQVEGLRLPVSHLPAGAGSWRRCGAHLGLPNQFGLRPVQRGPRCVRHRADRLARAATDRRLARAGSG